MPSEIVTNISQNTYHLYINEHFVTACEAFEMDVHAQKQIQELIEHAYEQGKMDKALSIQNAIGDLAR